MKRTRGLFFLRFVALLSASSIVYITFKFVSKNLNRKMMFLYTQWHAGLYF